MNIYFSKSEYNSYGSGLNEPFRYIGRIISDRFQTENIKFNFDEIEIVLAFYSKNVKNDQYSAWFNQLPIYYRRKNIVRVTLPVVNKQEDLTTAFQHIYKTFDILASKKKKDDILDIERTESTLIQLEMELQKTDLWELSNKFETILRQEMIERRLEERKLREKVNDEKKRVIYDLRFYYTFENAGELYFSPHDSILINEILERLRKNKFQLRNYTHLYIMVSDTFENALYHAVRAEQWFVYGIAILVDYISYPTKKEVEKKRIVFELIKQGLNDIAKIDKLETKILNDVLDEVEKDIFK
jgi:hypothetical protein